MPIYAYRCSECGHAKDVLQKMSDAVLSGCPACGAQAFTKQVTAAGFQLKGSGWYVTDFKGGDKAPAKPADDNAKGDPAKSDPAKNDSAKNETAKPDTAAAPAAGTKTKTDTAAAPAVAAAVAAPAPSAPAAGSK